MARSRLARLMVVIPIRGLEEAKSRLGQALDAEERRDLVTRLLRPDDRRGPRRPAGIDSARSW